MLLKKLMGSAPRFALIAGVSLGQFNSPVRENREKVSVLVAGAECPEFGDLPIDSAPKSNCVCDCQKHAGKGPTAKPREVSEDELLLLTLKKSEVNPEIMSLDEATRVERWMERFEVEYKMHLAKIRLKWQARRAMKMNLESGSQDEEGTQPAEAAEGTQPAESPEKASSEEGDDPDELEYKTHNIRQPLFHGWNILTRTDRKFEKSQLKVVFGIMKEEGLDERHLFIIHQALIESHWQWDAKSPAGAAGYWQFIPGTARDMGLVVDENMDQRMWLRKSTRAAIRYLKQLYRQTYHWDRELDRINECVTVDYSNPRRWAFALSSYNRGPHHVRDTYEMIEGDHSLYPVKMRDRYMETRNSAFLESASYVNKVTAARKALLAFEIRRRLGEQKICLDDAGLDEEEVLEYLMSLDTDNK